MLLAKWQQSVVVVHQIEGGDSNAALTQVLLESLKEFAHDITSIPIGVLYGLDGTLSFPESKHWDEARCERRQALTDHVALQPPGLADELPDLALRVRAPEQWTPRWQRRQLPALVQKRHRKVLEFVVRQAAGSLREFAG